VLRCWRYRRCRRCRSRYRYLQQICSYMQVQRCKVQGVVVVQGAQRCRRGAVGGAGSGGDIGEDSCRGAEVQRCKKQGIVVQDVQVVQRCSWC